MSVCLSWPYLVPPSGVNARPLPSQYSSLAKIYSVDPTATYTQVFILIVLKRVQSFQPSASSDRSSSKSYFLRYLEALCDSEQG